ARDAGRDDEHVGPFEVGPVARTAHVGVVTEDRAVLFEVERLALREILLRRDVEEPDVPELLVGAEARELAADVARTDETDLLARRHVSSKPSGLDRFGRMWARATTSPPESLSHVRDDVVAESAALDLAGAFHEPREVVRHTLARDGAIHALGDEV